MVNCRAEDVRASAPALRQEGCQVLDRIDNSEFGTFAWVIDPDDLRVELWQPPPGS
jgi:predicted enzyme related to lactoylglutathione lyase